MREIKFRAWDKEEQKMLDWDKFFNLDIAQVFESKGSWGVYPMQYTGLKDKNGVEFFEGDIGWDDHQEVHGQVIFENGAFKYEWENISEDLFEATDDIEIVGNIHENPELLEGN